MYDLLKISRFHEVVDYYNSKYKEKTAYYHGGRFAFLNAGWLYTTCANDVTEKILTSLGFTIVHANEHSVWVPNDWAEQLLDKKVERLIQQGVVDKKEIINLLLSDKDLRLCLAFNCDPVLGRKEEINKTLLRTLGRGWPGQITDTIYQMFEMSDYLKPEKFEKKFYEFNYHKFVELILQLNGFGLNEEEQNYSSTRRGR